MARQLSEEIRKRATEGLRGLDYLQLCDPGTCFRAEGRTLVSVQDKATSRILWLEVSDTGSE